LKSFVSFGHLMFHGYRDVFVTVPNCLVGQFATEMKFNQLCMGSALCHGFQTIQQLHQKFSRTILVVPVHQEGDSSWQCNNKNTTTMKTHNKQ
tara:strand:+ start:845 stop:1123 length:279 start_codon:yes stop_codon:yes gene_type:complete